jgi:hypothetical protein
VIYVNTHAQSLEAVVTDIRDWMSFSALWKCSVTIFFCTNHELICQ